MLEKAIVFAITTHKDQKRKDNNPYIVHPFEVALLLAKANADDNLIAAGLLHDTIEDGSISKETLLKEFNEDIASLVSKDSEDKSKSWEERKEKVLSDVKNSDERYKLLVLADKLANLKDLDESIRKDGDMIWTRFKRGKKEQAWFFNELINACDSLKDKDIYKEYVYYVNKLFKEELENGSKN